MPSPPSMRSELLRLMRYPATASALSLAEWSRLLPVARQAKLHGRLAHTLEAAASSPPFPMVRVGIWKAPSDWSPHTIAMSGPKPGTS